MKEVKIVISEKIVDFLSSLPLNTETSVSIAYKEVYGRDYMLLEFDENIGWEGIFEINSLVQDIAYKRGMVLEDSYYDEHITGLPFRNLFIIKKKYSKCYLARNNEGYLCCYGSRSHKCIDIIVGTGETLSNEQRNSMLGKIDPKFK